MRSMSLLMKVATLCMGAVALAHGVDDVVPRNIRIDGTKFVDAVTGQEVILEGSNVVMKGAPWIPDTQLEKNPVTGGKVV